MYRNARQEEELRCTASFAGDDGVESAVLRHPRDVDFDQSRGIVGHDAVWSRSQSTAVMIDESVFCSWR